MSGINNVNKKKWVIILIISLMVLAGVVYYVSPEGYDGLRTEEREDVNLLVIGMDDEKVDQDQEIKADAVVMITYEDDGKLLTFNSIPSDMKIDDQEIKNMNKEDLIKSVEDISGIDLPYYFVISYKGFKSIIDELEGIEINLDSSLRIPDLDLDLKEGNNLLTGEEALNYVRWYDYRKDEIDRLQRQQQVFNSIIRKSFKDSGFPDISNLYTTLKTSYKSIDTNMDKDLVLDIINYIRNRDDIEIVYKIITVDYN